MLPLVAGVPTGAVGIELADILVHVISKPLGIDAGQFDDQMLDIELTLRRALSSRKARASWGKARSAVKRYFHCSLCLVLLDLFATADTDAVGPCSKLRSATLSRSDPNEAVPPRP